MKETSILMFDEKDIELVENLKIMGVPRKVSHMVTYLASVPEATSREIERGANLRQPEISIALRTLRKNGWVLERDIGRSGKGRSSKSYRLCVPIETVARYYVDAKVADATRSMELANNLAFSSPA